jgi:NodT family efflux transporter outer membrane factor (OMF) lipoprotein
MFKDCSFKDCSKIFALLGMALPLAGCLVGPKYVKPAMPAPPAYKETAPDAYKSPLGGPAPDGTWKPAQPGDAMIKGKWWEIFNEPELNALEEQVNINNQNIAQYFQNFMAARAQVREARSNYYPTVGVTPSYSRTRSPGTLRGVSVASASGTGTTGGVVASSGTTSTDLALPFDVSWEPDLWGKIRNEVREYQNAAQVSAAELENERLTEQADLAEYFFELRGQDALQDLYNQTVDLDKKTLDLTKALVQTGIDSQQQAEDAEITLHNAEENAVGIANNRALYEHAIAMLIGKPASDFSVPVRSLTKTPPPIPLGVPSQLLQRRPDVAAAERTMAEANALIGFEKAAYYPTLSLTGSGGLESSMIQTLFTSPAFFWSLGASAAETIFDGGLRNATVAQYTAQFLADIAAYKQTVLTAFQQVEDYLATLRVSSEQIVRQQAAIDAAQRSLNLENVRYQTGIDPYLNVLDAQNTLLSDQQTQVSLRITEMTAAIELVQALGGGWDVSQLPTPAGVTAKGTPDQVKNTP